MCKDFSHLLHFTDKITSLCSDGGASRLCVWICLILLSLSLSAVHWDGPTVRTGGYDYLWQKQFRDYIWWKTLRVSREGGVYFSRKQTPLKKRRKERKMKINRAGKRSGNGQSLWHRWEPVWVQVMQEWGRAAAPQLRSAAELDLSETAQRKRQSYFNLSPRELKSIKQSFKGKQGSSAERRLVRAYSNTSASWGGLHFHKTLFIIRRNTKNVVGFFLPLKGPT